MSRGACPNCGESLDGDELPNLPGRTRDRRIPLELTYLFKGIVVIWRCPDCGFGWPRFDQGPMHDAVVKHLASEDQQSVERPPTGHERARQQPLPLPEIDPDRKVRRVPGVPLEGQQPHARKGVQRAGARTGRHRR